MNTEIINVEIQDKDLELVVSEKTLGSLTTNARQIKEVVERALPKYDIANYNEENIDAAKKDKAMLNGAAKMLNTKRLEIEREFTKPFDEFKSVVNETVKLISECSSKIDIVVKQSDQKYKDEKKSRIEAYFVNRGFTLVPFAKLFDERYLNKTFKEKDAFAEIDAKIAKINDDMKTLEATGEDAELLKSIYLDSLDVNKAIQYAARLRENRERAQREAEARAKAEAERAERERMEAEAREKMETKPVMNNISVETEKRVIDTKPVDMIVPEAKIPEMLTRAFKVTTTRENIIALGNFMNERGIEFEKIEL